MHVDQIMAARIVDINPGLKAKRHRLLELKILNGNLKRRIGALI